MTAYTKGPWTSRAARFPSDGGIDYGIGAVVDGKERCIAEAFEVVDRNIKVDAQANASLIACAPDMLEALKKITAIENDDYGGDWDEIEKARDIARAIINKAEGM